jgi:hypothetical protein
MHAERLHFATDSCAAVTHEKYARKELNQVLCGPHEWAGAPTS